MSMWDDLLVYSLLVVHLPWMDPILVESPHTLFETTHYLVISFWALNFYAPLSRLLKNPRRLFVRCSSSCPKLADLVSDVDRSSCLPKKPTCTCRVPGPFVARSCFIYSTLPSQRDDSTDRSAGILQNTTRLRVPVKSTQCFHPKMATHQRFPLMYHSSQLISSLKHFHSHWT